MLALERTDQVLDLAQTVANIILSFTSTHALEERKIHLFFYEQLREKWSLLLKRLGILPGSESRLILWYLMAFPSLSKLVVAEVVQLLSCPSKHLTVILFCQPRGSSDDSKEQIVSWRSLHCFFLSKPLVLLWEASSQSWYLFSLPLLVGDPAVWPPLPLIAKQLGLQAERILGKYTWIFRNIDC